jgi:protein-S-isoprenylcysteine O-methyltransferase Ste14
MDILSNVPFKETLEQFGTSLYWPLPFVLWPVPAAIPFWAVFLWARASERAILSGASPTNSSARDFDRGSWLLINHGWRVVRVAAVLAAILTPPLAAGAARSAVFVFSLLLMIGGALLRQHCIRILGDHFTYEVKVSAGSPIVTRGLYKWVRHPSYTGGMLFNLGLGLALTNWNSIALVVVGMLVIYIYRVYVEEQALIAIHRADYVDYMQHTKRFVPFLF